LFAPGNHPVYVEKVSTYGADVVVLDLEDAVPLHEKAEARRLVASSLARGQRPGTVAVRVNGTASGLLEADLAAVVGPGVDGIVLPKLESSAAADADEIIAERERATGIPVGSTWLVGIVETARGLVDVERLAEGAPARLAALCLGWADLALDARMELTTGAVELLYARSRIVFASRAAGLDRPLDGPWLWLEDKDGLAADCDLSRRLGFQGRVVVHPRQVEPVQRGYGALARADLARHRAIVESFEAALARGSASVRIEGQFVDYPIYEHSRDELYRYAQKGAR
jgi:citrate lyase subunit beta/citryl-CoA lyase